LSDRDASDKKLAEEAAQEARSVEVKDEIAEAEATATESD